MNWNKNKLVQLIATTSLVAVANIASSSELSTIYRTSFDQHQKPSQVYKFTGRDGQITYSSSIPDDFIQVKKIAITAPPSDVYVKDTQQRYNALKMTAEELGEAREQREAVREEEERKRLERLALINQSKPQQPVYERDLYVGYPYRLWRTYGYGKPHRPVHRPPRSPVRGHHPSIMPLPPSNFSTAFGR